MKKFKPAFAIIAGIAMCVAVAVLFVKIELQTAFLGAAGLPLLIGFAFKIANKSELIRYTAYLSVPILLGYAVVWTIDWSWICLLFMPFSIVGALLGLLLRKRWAEPNFGRVAGMAGGFAVIVIVTLLVFLPYAEVWDFTQVENRTVPPFKLKTLDQKIVNSSELKGKVLVLDFWATWCGPCIKQFPEVERLQKKYRNNSDVYVAAVNTSWKNSMKQARSFVKKNSLDIKVLYDTEGQLAENLGIKSIPNTVIIGKNRHLRVRHAGFTESMDYVSIMSKHVNKLLKQ